MQGKLMYSAQSCDKFVHFFVPPVVDCCHYRLCCDQPSFGCCFRCVRSFRELPFFWALLLQPVNAPVLLPQYLAATHALWLLRSLPCRSLGSASAATTPLAARPLLGATAAASATAPVATSPLLGASAASSGWWLPSSSSSSCCILSLGGWCCSPPSSSRWCCFLPCSSFWVVQSPSLLAPCGWACFPPSCLVVVLPSPPFSFGMVLLSASPSFGWCCVPPHLSWLVLRYLPPLPLSQGGVVYSAGGATT